MIIGDLKHGDVYGNGKYVVLDKDQHSIGILRIEDNHRIRFHHNSANWQHIVNVTKK